MNARRHPGVLAALGAALLFGASTPVAKLLLGPVDPWLLAGLFYLGSGFGLALWRIVKKGERAQLAVGEIKWLAGAILFGGMIAPVLLMWGLVRMPASGAALLLNAEGVLTALLAWFVFRENVDRRIAIGMAFIVAGAAVLSWPTDARIGTALPAIAIVGACLGWAIDNNLTRKTALADATFIAMTKGLVAGSVNVSIAWMLGVKFPPASFLLVANVLGFLSYGVSLVLFVIALRHLGTARTGAYFSIAPFAGAFIAIPLNHESVSAQLLISAGLMAFGVWLHLTERHEHEHTHEAIEHEHEHIHDEHHRHSHAEPVSDSHTHKHHHEPLKHSHPHYPDSHHRHDH